MANSKSEKYLNAMKDVKDNGMAVRAAAKKWGVPKSSLYDRLSGKVKCYQRLTTESNSKSEKYLNALKDVKENGLTVRAAAKKWDVPKSSLFDRLSGKVEYYRRSGPPTVLTREEETHLADMLLEMEKRGCIMSKDDVFDLVKKMLDGDKRDTPFINNRPGNKWLRLFLARNNIHLNNMFRRDKKHAKISDYSAKWFSDYVTLIKDHSLADSPGQIWKCEKVCFHLKGRHGKIVSIVERSHKVKTESKEQLTLLSCFNACGQWIPPYIVIPGKRVPKSYNPLEGGAPGMDFSVTESGNMDAASLYLWLEDHFIPNIPPARPVVLLADTHKSHIDKEVFEMARKNGIEIIGNATHLDETADNGFFFAMKETWDKHVRKYNIMNPNTDITKKNFCFVFKSTWKEVMHVEILIDAFRSSGLYPLDKTETDDNHHDNQVATTSDVIAIVEIDSTISVAAKPSSPSNLDHQLQC